MYALDTFLEYVAQPGMSRNRRRGDFGQLPPIYAAVAIPLALGTYRNRGAWWTDAAARPIQRGAGHELNIRAAARVKPDWRLSPPTWRWHKSLARATTSRRRMQKRDFCKVRMPSAIMIVDRNIHALLRAVNSRLLAVKITAGGGGEHTYYQEGGGKFSRLTVSPAWLGQEQAGRSVKPSWVIRSDPSDKTLNPRRPGPVQSLSTQQSLRARMLE
ncbi:hypothetical protein DFH09DRAFT_1091378 [Mycena vulgaris]|nr:hypothetical protein DFH09DRAFT_1091378 [Mycena vulgaris]